MTITANSGVGTAGAEGAAAPRVQTRRGSDPPGFKPGTILHVKYTKLMIRAPVNLKGS